MTAERTSTLRAALPLRVVLIAEEAAGGRALRLLHDAPDVSIEAVLASPSRRGMGSVWTMAERAGLPLVPAERVKDPALADELRARDIDLVLNVHSLYIVHPSLLGLPRLGAYNLHPGPLPEMAGLNVPSWAILLGHRTHGVTLHRMEPGIDEGDVAFEDRFPISHGASGLTLSLECVKRGIPLIERLLETVRSGEPVPRRPQDLSRRRYFDRRAPDGGSIDFDRPARHIEAHVRAADYRPFPSPWGHPRVRGATGVIELVDVVLRPGTEGARPLDAPGTVRHEGSGVRIACADGWIGLERALVDGATRPAREVLVDGELLAPVAMRPVPV